MLGIEFHWVERLSRPYRAVDNWGRKSRACGPGYNITGFQPLDRLKRQTQGVALGWNSAGALPLNQNQSPALDGERAEMLENIKALL